MAAPTASAPPRRRGTFARQIAIVVLSIGTLAMLAWIGARVDGAQMLAAWSAFRLEGLALAVLAFVAALAFRTWRLAVLLPVRVAWRPLLSVMILGTFAMNVLPLRAGELVRPWLLADRHEVPWGTSLGAIAVERVLDLVGLAVIVLLTGALVDVEGAVVLQGVDLLQVGLATAQVTSAVAIVGLAVVGIVGPRATGWVETLTQPLGEARAASLVAQFEALVAALRALGSPRVAVGAGVGTVGAWVCTTGIAWGVLVGLDGLGASWVEATASWAAASTAMVLFPSPGFLGGFEAACVAMLEALGRDPSVAAVFALAFHGLLLGGWTLLGGLTAMATGVDWRALRGPATTS